MFRLPKLNLFEALHLHKHISYVSVVLLVILFASNVLTQMEPPNCADFPDGWFINNPINCRAYWHCDTASSDPRASECPTGFNFDEGNQKCNLPEIYPCADDPTTTTTEPTDPEPTTTTAPPPTPNPPIPSERCEGITDGQFLNDPTHCRSYFVCMDGVAIPGQCVEGMNFNEELQICDTPTGTPCDNSNFECPDSGISRWEIIGNCTFYNLCFGGQHSIEKCAPGLQFDSSISQCQRTEFVECTRDTCPVTNDVGNRVTFPSETSCEEYYVCLDGSPLLQRCAPNVHWNQESGRCEAPEDANCELPVPPEPTTTPYPPFEIDCPPEDGTLHKFPHPFNCVRYFVCSGNTPHEQSCADGLYFDSIALRCDFPERATCADGISKISKVRPNFLSKFIKMFK